MTDVPVSEISLSQGEEKDLVVLPVSTPFAGHMDLDTYFLKKIRSPGEINESDHSVQSNETIVTEASFRGRHLLGKELDVPEGYQGVVLEEKTGKSYLQALFGGRHCTQESCLGESGGINPFVGLIPSLA